MPFDTATNTFTGKPAKAITCWCSIEFVIPESLYDYYIRKDGGFALHCPIGHQFVPKQSQVDKLRDELTRERARLDQVQADEKWYREAYESSSKREVVTERRLRAHKGMVTKLKNRVANGVCPCCHAKFKNLRDHMKAEHPDWNPEKGAEALASKSS